ncbi:MAG TPA: inositol monophosphatase [Tepidiformaceae bacterium]|mgnify:CR=1 FL=1|nr:inositol monophosphatase [Tepidiformaceae bacterium]
MELPQSREGLSARVVAELCAEVACAAIREGYGKTALAGVKGRGNVVTETDFAAESAAMAVLRHHFPDHAILSEETAASTRSDSWMWVIDPLDGTKNFSRGIPHFAFNLALCLDSQPVLGLTEHPLLGDRFVAVTGEGATHNGSPARVGDAATVLDSVVALDMGYDADRAARQLQLATKLWPGMQSLRISGSAALGFAYLAGSRWDIFIHSDLQPWDVAAGLILVREAGGIVTNRDGSPATIESRAVVAATPGVHADFMRLAARLPWEA